MITHATSFIGASLALHVCNQIGVKQLQNIAPNPAILGNIPKNQEPWACQLIASEREKLPKLLAAWNVCASKTGILEMQMYDFESDFNCNENSPIH